ncbi:MAG: transcription antitermination factor NusB [Pseudomonadota bacterium]
MASSAGIPARQSAIWLLGQIIGEGRLMAELIGAGALDHLSPPDRARAQRLAEDTLRGMERADRLLQRHVQKQPPLPVRNALRLGTVELCGGGAAHGVVNDLVQIVGKDRRFGRMKGLVNAVLRKIAAEGPSKWDGLRIPRLPVWLRNPLKEAWGPKAIMAIEAAHFAGAPLDLSAKPDADLSALGGEALPTGSLRLQDAGQVSALPGFEAGDWWVQDAAAALPALVLAPKPGAKVLDLCAAPGGKTLQLAAMGADVTAVDISEARLGRLHANLKRTGLKADVIAQDALTLTGAWDAILLDAPCSATGTIRRHPDLPYAKDGSEFAGLMDLQARLLDHAWSLLKPGGRMVFCTCSLLPDEGEVQIIDALDRHKDMNVDIAALDRGGIDPAWRSDEGGLRLRPDFWAERGGMDGFYIAALRKGA